MKVIDYKNFISQYLMLSAIIFTLIFSAVNSNGQVFDDLPKNTHNSEDSTSQKKDSSVIAVELKAVKFSLENMFDTLPVSDTILSFDFPYFNDLDRIDFPIVNNGFIGSSAMPIDGYGYDTGFKFGLNQYRLYNIEENIFHLSNVPFTTLYFSPGSKPSEFTTRAKFAKTFKDITLNINYARISNIGKYKNQKNKHTNVDFGFWKGSLNSRFNTFVDIIASVHQESQNGGIVDIDKLYEGGYSYRENVPVSLDDALTRFDNYELNIHEYYRIYTDRRRVFGFSPYFIGNVVLSKGFYKYFDVNIIGDSSVYKAYGIDKSGLRNYLNYSILKSDICLFGVKESGKFIKVGLDYERTSYNHEPLGDIGVNQVFVYTKAVLNAFKYFELNLDSKMHIGDISGDYNIILQSKYHNPNFTLEATISNGLYSPSFYNENLWLSRNKVYSIDFNKIGELVLRGGLSVKRFGFSAYVEKHVVNNFIYYNDSLLPNQLSESLKYTKINVKENLRIGMFHLDNNLFLYQSLSDKKPLPGYTLRSKFYLAPHLFKRRLFLQTGVEFNYWDKFDNFGFNPVLGNYYIQNNTQLDNYSRLDFYLSAKIDYFLFYVRFNNVLSNTGIKVPFKVLNYPQNDMFFRIGVQWTLVQ